MNKIQTDAQILREVISRVGSTELFIEFSLIMQDKKRLDKAKEDIGGKE